MSEIIEKLKTLRQEHQLTALEISIGCRSTERTVWRWIHGGNSPSPQAIIEIEKFIKETRSKAEKEEKEKLERCETVILNEIFNGLDYVFFSRPRPGEKFSEGTYPVGISQKDVSLMSLSKACELRLNDPVILKTLDNLAQKGLIKITLIFVPPRKNFEHMAFQIEIGEARRDIPAQDVSMEIVRAYRDKPLSQQEIKSNPGILGPKKQVEAIYERHENSLKLRYGASGLEKEVELHHEILEDEARARILQLGISESLAKINKGDKKMEGDHRPASEYNTLPNERVKVREFYEEKKTNTTNVTQVYYDCNHEKVVIEPGETKIILKMRMIEKMKVEKKK